MDPDEWCFHSKSIAADAYDDAGQLLLESGLILLLGQQPDYSASTTGKWFYFIDGMPRPLIEAMTLPICVTDG